MDLMSWFVQVPPFCCILDCKLCVLQLWGLCQAGAISPAAVACRFRCKAMLEDQVLFSCSLIIAVEGELIEL